MKVASRLFIHIKSLTDFTPPLEHMNRQQRFLFVLEHVGTIKVVKKEQNILFEHCNVGGGR